MTLEERMRRANTLLAPYAVPHEGVLGRTYEEPADELRFPFQRDRDRIIHTQAFRRLKGKTQVFVAGTYDHVRTRLTHTLEVAQISRDIARALGLNEDLTESIALAHDLGHPPFGHAGEEALNTWMQHHEGHFEHNEQSHRIVAVLAKHSNQYPGLNLNREILEGLLKHRPIQGKKGGGELEILGPSLEAQIVNIADEIAYTSHDAEDGIRSELFTEDNLATIDLARQARERARPRATGIKGALIHLLVMDLLTTTQDMITEQGIASFTDVQNATKPVALFSQKISHDLSELRIFLWHRMYLHPDVLLRSREGQRIVTDLCSAFLQNPNERIMMMRQDANGALSVAIKDYVSGMTDTFAKDMWHHMIGEHPRNYTRGTSGY